MPVGQQPGDRTAGVGTGVAPEAVQSFTASDTRVDRAPIWSKDLLFGVRESPAPQREPEGMASGIRELKVRRSASGTEPQETGSSRRIVARMSCGLSS